MTTTRTIATTIPGPVHLTANTGAFDLVVFTEDRGTGELAITTADDTGPSADVVNSAALNASGDRLNVHLEKGAGGVTIVSGNSHVQFGRGNVQVNSFGGVTVGGNNYGVISTGRGVWVNGQQVSGGVAMSPVQIVARLPHGSSVRFEAQSGDLRVSGSLAQVSAQSQSGDIDIDEVATVHAEAMSGDVKVGLLTGRAELKSMSGDITVHGGPNAYASARTMSGDVRGSGGLRVDGSSMSGRVRT